MGAAVDYVPVLGRASLAAFAAQAHAGVTETVLSAGLGQGLLAALVGVELLAAQVGLVAVVANEARVDRLGDAMGAIDRAPEAVRATYRAAHRAVLDVAGSVRPTDARLATMIVTKPRVDPSLAVPARVAVVGAAADAAARFASTPKLAVSVSGDALQRLVMVNRATDALLSGAPVDPSVQSTVLALARAPDSYVWLIPVVVVGAAGVAAWLGKERLRWLVK